MVLNFEKFDKPKTIDNVCEWMNGSFDCVTLKASDIDHMAADGGSNAIGSISEYESISRTSRGNDVSCIIQCMLCTPSQPFWRVRVWVH
jgi:hypothetical protein